MITGLPPITCCGHCIRANHNRRYRNTNYKCRHCGLAVRMRDDTLSRMTRFVDKQPQLTEGIPLTVLGQILAQHINAL